MRDLQSTRQLAAGIAPGAAWQRAHSALAGAEATLPAFEARNVGPVLGDLARVREALGSHAGVGPLVLVFDNCCAAHKQMHVTHTYTCSTGDSYSYEVVQVGGGGFSGHARCRRPAV